MALWELVFPKMKDRRKAVKVGPRSWVSAGGEKAPAPVWTGGKEDPDPGDDIRDIPGTNTPATFPSAGLGNNRRF